MKELHIHIDRFGSSTKLTDENGVEIRNVKSLSLHVEGHGFVEATLVMTQIHLDGVVDGAHVEEEREHIFPARTDATTGNAFDYDPSEVNVRPIREEYHGECPFCGGTGTFEGRPNCDACHGSGRV